MSKLFRLVAVMALAASIQAQPALRMKAVKRDGPARIAAADQPQQTRTPGRSHLLVQFADNPTDDQLSGLRDRGATILSYVPDFAVSVSAPDDASFDGLGAVWIGRLQPQEKISPELVAALAVGVPISVLVEFYSDVAGGGARAIATGAGLIITENPDLAANHLLLLGTADQVLSIAGWDEVAYIFPASQDLIQGTPVRGCVGAATAYGPVGQSIALLGDGWDGPGRGGADLKYAFVQLTQKLPADSVKAEIVRAFSEWAKYAKLTFTPTTDFAAPRSLNVLFASGDHGDGYPFDGPGGVLAHTFYPYPLNPEPIAGDLHFDADEAWRIGADVDVFSIALHETGHALGLGHSDVPSDVMYPYYHRASGLTLGDISAILQLYAAQGSSTPPAGTPVSPLVLSVQPPASPTTAASVTITGTTTGGSGSVQVTWTSNRGGAGTAQGSATWSIAAIPLSVGDNAITITARDAQQNQVTHSMTITRQPQQNPTPTPTPNPGPDTTPPSLVILSPGTTNPSTSASTIVISGTAHDNVAVAAVTWTSSTGQSGLAIGTDNWATPAIPVYVGTTTITIRAADAAGNSSWRSLTVTRH